MNKRVRQRIFPALMALLLLFLLCQPQKAEAESVRSYPITGGFLKSDDVTVYALGDERSLLLSCDGEETLGVTFSSLDGACEPVLSLDFAYTASAFSGGRLYLAASTMYYNENNQFIPVTDVKVIPLTGENAEELRIYNLYVENPQDFAVLRDGTLCFINRDDRNAVRLYHETGEPLLSLESRHGDMESLLCPPGASQLFVTYQKGGALSRYQPGGTLIDCAGTPPQTGARFLSDDTLLDETGAVYRLGGDNSLTVSFTLLKAESRFLTALGPEGILSALGDGVLYLHRNGDGRITRQLTLSGGPLLGLFTSGQNQCLLRGGDTGYTMDVIEPGSLSPVVYEASYDNRAYDDAENFSLRFQEHSPLNESAGTVYAVTPDTKRYATEGQLSQPALADGLSSLNFYRSVYSLDGVLLNAGLSYEQQCGALLQAVLHTTGGAVPEGMDGAMVEAGRKALSQSFLYKSDTLQKSPLSDAVNALFSTDAAFREALFSYSLAHACFGAATLSSGETFVLVRFEESGGTSRFDSPFTPYPAGGAYPVELLSQGALWSVHLNSDYLTPGAPGGVTATYRYGDSGETELVATVADADGVLQFSAPSKAKKGNEIHVLVENLLSPDGRLSSISFSVRLFSLDEMMDQPENELRITSDVYQIDRGQKRISGVAPSTTRAQFKENLSYPRGELIIRNQNGQIASSKNAGTGMTVQLVDGGAVYDELQILVRGDCTGEGNVNTLDYRALQYHLLGTKPLDGLMLLACDVNRDNKVSTLDLLCIDKYLSGSYDIL